MNRARTGPPADPGDGAACERPPPAAFDGDLMLPITRPTLPPLEEYVALLADIWQSRMLSNFGKYAKLFESKAQTYLGNPLAHCVVNCDIGLVLALAALDLPSGAECLVPSFTFNSTINALLWNRLRPVFVDLDPQTFNVDVADVERRITPRTAALLATHVFGSPSAVRELLDLGAQHRLPVVFDAAHAFGAVYQGQKIGGPDLGDFQVFSFSGTKPVTSAEGGLIVAGKREDAERVEYLRAYGFRFDYNSEYVGLNAKMSELHAALATLTIDMVEQAMTYRGHLACAYRAALEPCAAIRFQRHLPGTRSTYKDMAVVCAYGRDALAAHLQEAGIQTKQYFLPAHTMTAFQQFVTREDD